MELSIINKKIVVHINTKTGMRKPMVDLKPSKPKKITNILAQVHFQLPLFPIPTTITKDVIIEFLSHTLPPWRRNATSIAI